MDRRFVSLGAFFGFLAVAFGAFGTHTLRDRLTVEALQIWQTGVQYHLAHALALVLVGLIAPANKPIRTAGWLFAAGIVVFGGSLYLLALTGTRILGAITPLGGLCFLGGWLCLSIGAGKREPI